jgi:predicted nucleotidyltransferase
MLSAIDHKIATLFKQRLQGVGPVLDVRVFGSRARGDAEAESDLDIFVQLESVTPPIRRQISETAWEVGFEMDRIISTLVATREQIEHGALGASPVIQRVMEEGVSV